jgi:hypothetical protein
VKENSPFNFDLGAISHQFAREKTKALKPTACHKDYNRKECC